jgi:hypothetical protein
MPIWASILFLIFISSMYKLFNYCLSRKQVDEIDKPGELQETHFQPVLEKKIRLKCLGFWFIFKFLDFNSFNLKKNLIGFVQ